MVEKPARRSIPTAIKVALPIIAVFAAAILIVVSLSRLQQTVIRKAIALVQQGTGVRVEYGQVEGDIRHRLDFHHVRMILPAGDSFLCAQIDVSYGLRQLITRRYRVRDLEIDSPQVFLNRASQGSGPGAQSGRTLPRILFDRIAVNQGRLVLAGQPAAESIDTQLSLVLDSSRIAARFASASGYLPLGDSGPGLAVPALSGSVMLQGADLQLESIQVRTDLGQAQLSGTADLDRRRFDLALSSLDADLAKLHLIPGLAGLRVSGRVSAQGRVRCELTDSPPRLGVDLKFSASDLDYQGIRLARLTGSLADTEGRLNCDLALHDTVSGNAHLTGDIDLRTLDYHLAASIEELDLRHLPWSGNSGQSSHQLPDTSHQPPNWVALLPTMSGDLTVSGRKLTRVKAELSAHLSGLPFDSIGLSGGYENGILTLDRLLARGPATATGPGPKVRLAGVFCKETLDLNLAATAFPLEVVRPWLGGSTNDEVRMTKSAFGTTAHSSLALAGALTGTLQAHGALSHLAVKGAVNAVSGRVAGFGFGELQSEFDVPNVTVLDGEVDLTLRRASIGSFSAELARLTILRHHFDIALEVDTALQCDAAGEWDIKGRQIAATFSSFQVSQGADSAPLRLVAERPFDVRLELGTPALQLTISDLEMSGVGGRLSLNLRTRPDSTPDVSLQADNIDLGIIGRLARLNDSLRGRVSMTVQPGAGSPGPGIRPQAPWSYAITLDASDLAIDGLPIELNRVLGVLQLDQTGLAVEKLQLIKGTDTSVVTGTIAMDFGLGVGGANHQSPALSPQSPILNLHTRLRNPGVWMLDAILKPTIYVQSGELFADLSLTGTFANPVLSGQARMLHGQLFLSDISLLVTDAGGQFAFDHNHLTISQLRGMCGDGDVIVGGDVVLSGFKGVEDLNLDIQARSVSLPILPNVVGVVTGRVGLRWGSNRPVRLSGSATVDEALVTIEFGSAVGPSGAPAAPDSMLQLDLKLTAEHNVWFRNRTVDLELQGDVSVTKNPQGMFISGEMETRQGRVYTLDHAFQVTRGVMRFDDPAVIDPSMDIVAELPSRLRDSTAGGKNQPVKILVSLSGTLSKPLVTLSSDPAVMTESDISYYLATNITPSELSTQDNRAIFNRLVSDRLLSYVSREVTSRLQGYVGLDVLDLQVPSLGTGAGLKITVGKYIGRSLFVSYTASTTQLAPDQFKVEYFVSQGREIVAERTEDGTYDLRLQVKLRY